MRSKYVEERLAALGEPRVKSSATRQRRSTVVADDYPPGHFACSHYIKSVRKNRITSPNWFDVRDAYLAGYKFGQLDGPSKPCPTHTDGGVTK